MGSMKSKQNSNVQRVEIADRFPPKTKSDFSKLETMEILYPNIIEDTCTVGTRGCCQHNDEPLPHSRNSPNQDYSKPETLKNLLPNITKDTCTVGTTGFCQHDDEPLPHSRNSPNQDYSKPETLENLLPNITEDTCTVGTRGCCQHNDEPLPHSRNSPNQDYSKPETLKNLLPNITEDTCTVGTSGCCQHDDEPLPHSRNSPNKVHDQLEDRKRSKNVFPGNLQRSGGSEDLQRQDKGLKRSKTFNSEGLQTPNELYYQYFSDLTHHAFEGTQGINPVLQKGLQAIILQILMFMKIAGKFPHAVISMAILTLIPVACAAVQVHINCTSGAVITSPNYPTMYQLYERKEWNVNALEGRRILLTFNHFSLGASDKVEVIDPADDQNRQCYSGEEITIPPFMSRNNSLILRLTSNGNPTGNGFNISASCYKLPASFGFCNQTDDVMNGSWDSNITWVGSIVHLTCDDGYRLNGSGTLQCATGVSPNLPVWNGSTPTCEMITDTLPVTSGPDNAGIAISSSMTALYMCIICAAVVHLMQLQ
ncbi:uncharacterized protein LOC105443521 [Strongylocentrotus purpuratus]|uniref:Uncharacterized protein n=1 Tax=Strongylocentrotus purpuratus TaxID=7668 RepID=A0A7M7NNH3_STRPU|nr:uncharacterized protein LOC105443521 [Strongylocentrotus purpuratus]